MEINVLMPALSPTMVKGNLTKWYKKVGDRVRSGDLLVEIETEKSVLDYESPEVGILKSIVVPAGSRDIEVGSIIAVLGMGG